MGNKSSGIYSRELDAVMTVAEAVDAYAMMQDKIEQLRAENQRLRAALRDAADDIESWGSYADKYFQDKHDLNGDVSKYKQIAICKLQQDTGQ